MARREQAAPGSRPPRPRLGPARPGRRRPQRPGWARARARSLGRGSFPDGAEAVNPFDADDGGFGCAVHLASPACGEWGDASLGA